MNSLVGISSNAGGGVPCLANNSRLLVLPECHSPNLISRFMKLMLARLSADWLEHWGHPLALVETFVDPQLYQGTAYKVSGWSHLGKTAGWKRDAADFYIKHDAPKQIWVRELVKKACVKLRAAQLPPEWAKVEDRPDPLPAHSSRDPQLDGKPAAGGAGISPGPSAGLSPAGMVCLIVMAMASGVRQGPEDLAKYADTLSQPQLRALGFRQDRPTGGIAAPRRPPSPGCWPGGGPGAGAGALGVAAAAHRTGQDSDGHRRWQENAPWRGGNG